MTGPQATRQLGSSFRDPDGFVFEENGEIFRQVNQSYKTDFEQLIGSGLYSKLVDKQLLLPHDDVTEHRSLTNGAFKVIKPQRIPFISYPYEWSYEQLRAAALVTLQVQRAAVEHGMTLKDGTAFNVQFLGCHPIFIDTLSFAVADEGMPWPGYRQFCRHFLAPLLLGKYRDRQLTRLLLPFLDGIPLDVTSKLLPWTSWIDLAAVTHVHMQAKLEQTVSQASTTGAPKLESKMSKQAQLGILDNLQSTIAALPKRARSAGWENYYDDNNYTAGGITAKETILAEIIAAAKPNVVWDLGANTGRFSRIAAKQGSSVVAFDQDENCVSAMFEDGMARNERQLLPLVLDLTNPTPAAGWQHAERLSLEQRGPADCVLALALIHHLIISAEIPTERLAVFFSKIAKRLIIEFVPMQDSQVQRMLSAIRRSSHPIDQDLFEREFSKHFQIIAKHPLPDSTRTLYEMVQLTASLR
jgi:hypothetical protein